MDFFPEIDVSALQAEAIARGLYAVAMVDGVHERELALISDFYRGAVEGSTLAASLDRVGPLEPKDVAQLLVGEGHRQLFVKAAYLLAWADGEVSDGERSRITEFADALDIAPDTQWQLEAQVKDFLLRPLSALENVEAVTKVAKKLGI
jgi:uncharacterized protein (DUF2384 family)